MNQKRWKKLPVYAFLEPLLGRASAIHATSAMEADSLLALGVRGPIVVVPNGADLAPAHVSVPGPPPSWRDRLNIPPDTPLLLMLGRLHPVKGIDIALNALKLFLASGTAAILVLAGPDDDGYGLQITRLAEELKVLSSLRRVGFVTGSDKEALLRESNVLLLLSRQENFGNVVLEALAQGTPVIATTTTPWAWLSEKKIGLSVPPEPATIVAAISRLLASPVDRDAFRARALRAIHKDFGWTSIATTMVGLYHTCVAKDEVVSYSSRKRDV